MPDALRPPPALALAGCLLAAASGCAPDAGDPGCHAATLEDHFRFDPYTGELPLPPNGVRVAGTFSAWDAGEVVFERDDGDPLGFFLLLEGQGTLPDLLASAPPSEPGITGYGFVASGGAGAEPLLRFGGETGDLRLLAGNVEMLEPLDGFTVRAPRDEVTCQSSRNSSGRPRIKPVYIGRDGEELRMFPGDRAVMGEFEVAIVSAQSNNRNHPWAPCSTEACPWEKLSWWIATLGSELLPGLD